ncbi:MAG TPA: CRTAC1 family protein [Vicinamibacterales bacterium]|nr:CRTAC1 family protein [Vicinamibacterales bacterium]
MTRAACVLAAAAVLSGAADIAVTARQKHAPEQRPAIRFTDATRQAGIEFRHINGASADKYLVETIGSGGLFFDYDSDGWIDIFLVDGGSIADAAAANQARHRLFRNRGNGTFQDVTAPSGIHHREYGMGACAGDYDNDGRVDLYVTNVGPNTLYRNAGGGLFTDVTQKARVGAPLWSAGCAFADLDRDGDLDLFVTNYVDIRLTASADASAAAQAPADTPALKKPDSTTKQVRNPFCGNARLKTRFYCHPLNFDPLANVVYRNDGNGTFTDVSADSGIGTIRSNGLGVVIADYDDDGWPEVFVANDSMPNFLFRRTGPWRFEEIALRAGVAVASDGKARAGMGTDAADYDGDGQLDLVVTNLDFEMHSLYRGLGRQLFAYATPESGIGPATLPFVGFGVAFFDADNDMQVDLAVANGHIIDNAPMFRAGATHAQRKLLFRNIGSRRFADVTAGAGPGFAAEKVGRSLAAGDIDNDGDLDLLVTNNGQSADLIRNDGQPGNAILVRLVGTKSNRDGVGARLRLTAGGRSQIREVKAGSSYLAQNDMRQHFGLAALSRADRLEVRWPAGRTDVIENVAANQIITVREGDGIVAATPFAR